MTSSLLQSCPQVRTPDPEPSSRRNGKIARLPKETRDMINRMLDDGLPYRVIIDELGEAGEGLNTQNLTNWKQGGYQEWVKNQELIDRMRMQTEFAVDLLKEAGSDVNPALILEACNLVGATQLLNGLMQHGDGILAKMLIDKPETYIRILNIIARFADAGLRYDKFHRLFDPPKPNQDESK